MAVTEEEVEDEVLEDQGDDANEEVVIVKKKH